MMAKFWCMERMAEILMHTKEFGLLAGCVERVEAIVK